MLLLAIALQLPIFARNGLPHEPPERRAIAGSLRESRRPDTAPPDVLVERIVDSGPGAAGVAFDVLVRRSVPPTAPDEEPQTLSQPQRELLLSVLARMEATAVRDLVDTRLEAEPGDPWVGLASVHALGAIGKAADLDRIAALALGEDTEPTKEAALALRAACASILRRDASASAALAELLCRADPRSGRALLEGLGDVRGPHALEVLLRAARCKPELRPRAATLAAACGRSGDPSVDRELALWALSELPSARSAYARSLLQAMGVLDDGTCVPAMIESLEDEDPGLRESALWALRRVSDLGFPGEVGPWLAWHKDEVAWHGRERARLRNDLLSRDQTRTVEALRAYADRRTKRAELSLDVVSVLSDPRPELRRLACEVLGRLGSPAICGELAAMLQDPDASVAEAAGQALRSITKLDLPREPARVFTILGLSGA